MLEADIDRVNMVLDVCFLLRRYDHHELLGVSWLLTT